MLRVIYNSTSLVH